VPPALIVLADAPSAGVPGVTDDAAVAEQLLQKTLDLARRVGGVGRVLLFHPPEEETGLGGKAFGFRLWPQEGATRGERYGNSFSQAADLGYDGAITIRLNVPDYPPALLTDAARMLEGNQGVIASDGRGGIAMLGLQRPEPNLFPRGEPDPPTYEELRTRAKQQLVRLVDLEPHEALGPDTVGTFLTD